MTAACLRALLMELDIEWTPAGFRPTTAWYVNDARRRDFIGIELNPEYAAMARRRIGQALRPATYRDDRVLEAPLFGASGNAG